MHGELQAERRRWAAAAAAAAAGPPSWATACSGAVRERTELVSARCGWRRIAAVSRIPPATPQRQAEVGVPFGRAVLSHTLWVDAAETTGWISWRTHTVDEGR